MEKGLARQQCNYALRYNFSYVHNSVYGDVNITTLLFTQCGCVGNGL